MNQAFPLVTIAIPTFNRADSYLPQSLQSALAQTYPCVEILVSDNCSSDHTEELVKRFDDPRIRYFRQSQNIGPNNNGNFCVEKAQGAYFLLLHDDDVLDPDFLETCMRAAGYKTDVGIIRTGLRLINSEGNIIGKKRNMVGGLSMDQFVLAWFDGKVWPYLCNTLYNTRGLQKIGGFRSKHNLFQDVGASMMLAAELGRVDVEDIKASARKHAEELTFGVKVVDWCEDSLELLALLGDLLPEKRELVRLEGLKFFSVINYTRVKAVRSLIQRISLYLMVYEKFNYSYSPISFIIRRSWLFEKSRAVARRVKRLVNGVFSIQVEESRSQ